MWVITRELAGATPFVVAPLHNSWSLVALTVSFLRSANRHFADDMTVLYTYTTGMVEHPINHIFPC